MRALIIAVVLAGCAVDAEPQLYTCTVLYRCQGDQVISAAIALPCAVDADEAADLARQAGIQAATERCTAPWQYVRPSCSVYQPAEACAQE